MKMTFIGVASIANETKDANARYAKALGLPFHKGAGRLAIVGGGSSVAGYIDELKAWDGEIWAINGAINWCIDHGIDAAFYTIDAAPLEHRFHNLDRVTRAVLSIDCDPSLFRLFASGQISLLPEAQNGPTSAADAPMMGVCAGYRPIVFFGCESSFGKTTHAYDTIPISDWMRARAGGETFITKPEFAEQAKILSAIILEFPDIFSEKSGGLLRAMIESEPDYDVEEMSPDLWAMVKAVSNSLPGKL